MISGTRQQHFCGQKASTPRSYRCDTLDTYSHVLPSRQQQAAAKLDLLFSSIA